MSTIFTIKIPKKTPLTDSVRRQTPPPTKFFRAARGPGSYRRQPRFRGKSGE